MSDAIERVGFTGSYLSEKETARRLRSGEVYLPRIATRLSIEGWRGQGRDELDAARERVREILAEADERGPKLDAEKVERLEAVVQRGRN